MKFPSYRKWDVLWINLPDTASHVICGRHPAVVISNNHACAKSQTIMVIAGTSKLKAEQDFYCQVVIPASSDLGIPEDTRFDCGRILTVDTSWVDMYVSTLLNTPYIRSFQEAMSETLELTRGLSYWICPHCGAKFVSRCSTNKPIYCKACNRDFMVVSPAPLDVQCKGCGMKLTGYTNAAFDKEHDFQCKCGTTTQFSVQSSALAS